MSSERRDPIEAARRVFARRGGVVTTAQAVRAGIHPRTLCAMRDQGIIEQVARGLYRLADLPPLRDPDLVSVAMKVPNGIVCLISALSFHQLTTQVPHQVWVALARGARAPRLRYPPLRVCRFTGAAFTEGRETHEIDGARVRVYSPEKTVADCFKYRNTVGVDVAVEALKRLVRRRRPDIDALLRFARVCRVQKVMRPYLEALL